MTGQRSLGTIRPSKRTATNAWRAAVETVAVLEAEEAAAAEALKAVRESLKEARAVEKSARVDLCGVLDSEDPNLPGLGDNREQPE